MALLAVLAAAGGWIAGRSISSPADIAEEAAPPEPSLITVPVERRELSTAVVVRGDVLLEGSFDIEVDASAGVDSGGVAVTTGTPLGEGDLVEEGAVLIEVGERPVIALQGELPMFRTLGPGSRGDDVLQLEDALVRLGFDPGVADGIYDQGTETAIEALYVQAGYESSGLTDDERSQLDLARSTVDDARAALTSAQASLSEATSPLPESQRLSLLQQRDGAEDALELAKTSATQAKADAAAATAAAVVAVDDATEALGLANERLAAAQGTDDEPGVHPDTGEAPTEDELVELADDVALATNVLASAEADHEAAVAAEAVVATDADAQIDDAEANLAIARASYDEQTAAPNTTFESQAVTDAQTRLSDAEADLAEIEEDTGIRVPRAEIVFVDTLPRRVQRLNVERGDFVNGTVMTVSGADITIESSVSASDRPLLKLGDTAVVDDESLGLSFEVTISNIADNPGGRAAEGRYYLEFTPTTVVEDDVAGLNLRATIPISTTGGEVLTVPLAALSAGGDGSVRVEIERADAPGETRTITVTTGLETTGFVEIRPVDADDEIAEGDRVVIGR